MICKKCGEPVRFGWRYNTPGWWHRDAKDHEGLPVVEPTDDRPEPIPPVERPCEPFDPSTLSPRSGVRQIIKVVHDNGWDLRSITSSRGPYMGSKGEMLSISDSLVLRSRGPVSLDGTYRIAVASWRDAKFDFAFIGTVKDGHASVTKANSDEMKDWIRGHENPTPSTD